MTDFVFNIAKGRFAEFAHRVDQNDPTNAVLVVAAFSVTGDQDAAIIDVDTLAAVEALASVAEVTNSGYSRLVLDDTDVSAVAADDTNNRMDIDFADFAFGAITAGDAWTDVLVGYDSDSTGGTDANIIPCLWADFAITPDGSTVTATLNASGLFRAS